MQDIQLKGDIDDNMVGEAVSGKIADNSTVIVNSNGGYIDSAMDIVDEIEKHKNVTVIAEKRCMSAAMFILLSVPVSQRKARKNTTFMIHYPSVELADGDYKARELSNIVTELNSTGEAVRDAILGNIDCDARIIDSMMQGEQFFTEKTALALGIISEIV